MSCCTSPQKHPNTCGCCEGLHPKTPAALENPPGLSSIQYRVGTHGQFLESMLTRLSNPGALPAEDQKSLLSLRGLTTRDPSDPTIALLDTFAVMADVLTFYQERIINESFLRTATERFSLFEMARLLSYRPNPGSAAVVSVALSVEDLPGGPSIDIPANARIKSIPDPGEAPQTFETAKPLQARFAWNALRPKQKRKTNPKEIKRSFYVGGLQTSLRQGDGLLMLYQRSWLFGRVLQTKPEPANDRTLIVLTKEAAWRDATTELSSTLKLWAMRQRASLFGYNAPDWNALPSLHKSYLAQCSTAQTSATNSTWPCFTIEAIASGNAKKVCLDAIYPQAYKDAWIVLSAPGDKEQLEDLFQVESVEETACTNFTLTAKVSCLTLNAAPSSFNQLVRETTVFLPTEELHLVEEPLKTPVERNNITLDRYLAVRDELPAGRLLLFVDKNNQKEAKLLSTKAGDGGTELTLEEALPVDFQREELQIYANVAEATHGETVEEILGSGNAELPNQQFRLRQAPLTYLSSAKNLRGAESTLQIWVQDLLWHEVESVEDQPHDARVYATEPQADGSLIIRFGDGVHGARLPTGRDNLRAIYRRGLGLGGNINAGTLRALVTKPLGLKTSLNPIKATGGEDPESLSELRQRLPRSVRTLSRVVSLRDYEDITFAGISRIKATWTWDDTRRAVLLTVAGPNGEKLDEGGKTAEAFLEALRRFGDPNTPIILKSYEEILFCVSAAFRVQQDFDKDKVKAAVEERLLEAFSFAARAFGQPVALSEVVSSIQATPGVLSVDVNALYLKEEGSAALHPRLPARAPDAGATRGAELLRLDKSTLTLEVRE